MNKNVKINVLNDRAAEDKIIIFDNDHGAGVLKKIIIRTPNGVREYDLRRTSKGGYLLN